MNTDSLLLRVGCTAMLAVASIALPGIARADDCIESLCSDRPDFTESSSVVGRGRFQIETGFQAEYDRAGGVHTQTLTTPTLLRIGLADTLELRFESDGWTHQRVDDGSGPARQHGGSDTSIGVKWHLVDGDDKRFAPSIGLLVDATPPTGALAFRGHGTRPTLLTVFEWELPSDWSLGVMPGVVRDSDDHHSRYTAGILSVTLAKGWTDTVETYFEVAGQQIAATRHGGSVVSLDTGATWRLSHDLQVDFGIARGLNRDTPDWAWTTGLSARF